MSNWKTYTLRSEIQKFNLLDPDKLLVHFDRCIMMAGELELSFWDEVCAYRGPFGMRMLIHAVLVAKGVR